MAPHMHSTHSPHSFASIGGMERKRSMSLHDDDAMNWAGISLAPLYLGAAAVVMSDGNIEVGISVHDGTYSLDFCVHQVQPRPGESVEDAIKRDALERIFTFAKQHQAKFIGAGISMKLEELCPNLAPFLWRELDIVVMQFNVKTKMPKFSFPGSELNDQESVEIDVDEQADSAVRKCIMYFGPQLNPSLSIGFRNKVEVDAAGKIQLIRGLDEYKNTVHPGTWNSVLKYASDLKARKVKIAFFSATPQGGGVALMRHALIRFFKHLGVNAQWYIPKPNPKVFRITKTNHNILQGVADPEERFDEKKQEQLTNWITQNACRYWLSEGGPLAEGGADVVVIDDPQMPGLIPLIREHRPGVKIIYRSHIEIRTDLTAKKGSPQEEVWDYLWDRIKESDLFISHPVDKFVPGEVPMPMVGLMPACTDWLDGLNKDLNEWNMRFYHHNLRNACSDIGMNKLTYPAREYIVQIARFDPSKGIPDVIESYRKLRDKLGDEAPKVTPPELLICGHGAIDDPDASIIYEDIMKQLDRDEYDEIREDIIVLRIGPSDQLLNACLSSAKIVLQLSIREGFEVKVSESLHKGKPTIATRAGGIPLQITDGKNGFLVDVGDSTAVATHLFNLYTDHKLYKRMSEYAKTSVSDEVGTVGNALCWMYLAHQLSSGNKVEPGLRWITDMAREEAGEPYREGEPRLPRAGIKVMGKV